MRPLRGPDTAAIHALIAEVARASPEAAVLHRLHCLALVAQGYSCYEAARIFGRSARSVERWVHAFEESGIEGLGCRRRQPCGGSIRLTPRQLDALRHDLAVRPRDIGLFATRWNGALLAKHIRRRYGVGYSVRQCQRLRRHLAQPDATQAVAPRG